MRLGDDYVIADGSRILQGTVTALLLGGVLGADVDGRERAAGAGDELLHPQLCVREERGASLVKDDATLVERDRPFQRLAAGLELRDGPLELGQRLVEGEGRGVGGGRRSSARSSSA